MVKQMHIARAKDANEIISKRDFFSTVWREAFASADANRASDLHVESTRRGIMIRFRIHGELVLHREITERQLVDQTLVRLKEIANLDISVRNDIQDGAFELAVTKSRYRAALAPSLHGESLVFRIIRDDETPKLADCKMQPQTESDLRWALRQKQGFICVTGPTGSGKSTTLQACINELDKAKLKIITLEDPIEREIEGVVQQQISKRLTWIKGIKIALRQDPDVILIGEIRDKESASLALEAAQTGHLVLSTLHANDVSGTIDRLVGLGVDRHLIADNLLFVSAQRLAKELCSNCRIKCATGYDRGAGCQFCADRGTVGRIPIIEYCVQPSRGSILDFDMNHFRETQLKESLTMASMQYHAAGIIGRDDLFGSISTADLL